MIEFPQINRIFRNFPKVLPIFSTQRCPRGRESILSTQRISEPSYIGGRCDRKWRFSKKETAFAVAQKFDHWSKLLSFRYQQQYLILSTQRISEPPDKGGRCNRKFRFPKRKKRSQGYIFLQRSHSTYTKITTLTNCEDVSLTKCQYFLLKTLTTCEDFLEETLTHVKIIYLTH